VSDICGEARACCLCLTRCKSQCIKDPRMCAFYNTCIPLRREEVRDVERVIRQQDVPELRE